MKIISAACILGLVGVSFWYGTTRLDYAPGVPLQGALPTQTKLAATPRSQFTPTTRKGFYNLDIVGDFTLPATKTITFSGAGRNLHAQQDPAKIFRRGFSAVDQSRMIEGLETWKNGFPARTWKSSLAINQRAWIVYQNYFRDSFGLTWAQSNDKASETLYRIPGQDSNKPTTTNRNSIYQASMELRGSCLSFGDCPTDWKSTYGLIFLDIENNYGIKDLQEQANLYAYMLKTIKENSSPQTLVGSIDPVAHNSFGYSRTEDYRAGADELLTLPARHTATSRRRGMPDDIVGKSFLDYADFVMPGTYYLYPEFDYSNRHNGDGDRHWLAALLGEQEVNMKLSPKKRIAWQWVFNTQSADLPNSAKSEHPAPPAIAEGMAVFYWFTGAYGALFWDDQINLTPNQPSPADPNLRGIGNDRNYAFEKDFVHLLTAQLQTLNPALSYQLQAGTGIELDFGRPTYKMDEFDQPMQVYKPDLVVIRLGENVADGEVAVRGFETQFRAFLDRLLNLSGGRAVRIVTSTSVWERPLTDAAIRKVITEKGWPLVDLHSMVGQSQYFAEQYADKSVAAHPNDAGMQKIADLIWGTIR